MRNGYTDSEIVKGIKIQDKNVLAYVYNKYRPMVIDYVTLNSGTVREAEDVLHDSVISVYRVMLKHEFSLTSTFENYFLTICKNTWKLIARTKRKYELNGSMEEHNEFSYEDQGLYNESDIIRNLIFEKFMLLSKTCQEILKLYYFERRRMKEIASIMNYKTDMVAVKKKFICLENLKVLVKGNPKYRKTINYE